MLHRSIVHIDKSTVRFDYFVHCNPLHSIRVLIATVTKPGAPPDTPRQHGIKDQTTSPSETSSTSSWSSTSGWPKTGGFIRASSSHPHWSGLQDISEASWIPEHHRFQVFFNCHCDEDHEEIGGHKGSSLSLLSESYSPEPQWIFTLPCEADEVETIGPTRAAEEQTDPTEEVVSSQSLSSPENPLISDPHSELRTVATSRAFIGDEEDFVPSRYVQLTASPSPSTLVAPEETGSEVDLAENVWIIRYQPQHPDLQSAQCRFCALCSPAPMDPKPCMREKHSVTLWIDQAADNTRVPDPVYGGYMRATSLSSFHTDPKKQHEWRKHWKETRLGWKELAETDPSDPAVMEKEFQRDESNKALANWIRTTQVAWSPDFFDPRYSKEYIASLPAPVALGLLAETTKSVPHWP